VNDKIDGKQRVFHLPAFLSVYGKSRNTICSMEEAENHAKSKPRGIDNKFFGNQETNYMSYDEEQHKRSRVVIETPTARREVVQTVTARAPERRGVSTGVVAALVIGAVALVTILFLFILNRQNNGTEVTANVSTSATPLPQQPVIIQQQQPTPLPQTPIIIQQPGTTTTTQPPIIIEQPAPATTAPATSSAPSGTDDAAIQSAIDKKMAEDATLSTIGVTVTVSNGKATLIGTVDTQALKNQVERLVKAVKGVRTVDSQIIVSGG
jgi:BON domain